MKAHVLSLSLFLRAPEVKVLQASLQRRSPWLSLRGLQTHVARTAVEPRPALQDTHGRKHDYLRISLTERCNLRCKYCMPLEGVPLQPQEQLLTPDEVVQLARTFASLGVRKVRLTGGEPTLNRHLTQIIEGISSLPGIEAVAITTNALVLTRQLPALQRAGLTHINISLDSLKADRYETMARRAGLSRVLAGIDLALQLGYNPVKVNTVLMRGFNDDEICDFAEYTKDRNVEVRFIEFMPFSGNKWEDSRLVPHREAVRTLTNKYPDAMPCITRPNDTARVWKIPGYAGSVGFISSMTNHFCNTCNRLRITADGNLKVCLFGNAEVSLRDALRGGATELQLEQLIRTALANKKPKHAEIAYRPAANRPSQDNGLNKNKKLTNTNFVSDTNFGSTKSALNFGPISTTNIEQFVPGTNFKSTVSSTNFRSDQNFGTTKSALNFGPTKYALPNFSLVRCNTNFGPITSTTNLKPLASGTNFNPNISSTNFKQKFSSMTLEPASKPSNNLWKPPALYMPNLKTKLTNHTTARAFSNTKPPIMTHLDSEGRARMVDVGEKAVTSRTAAAECILRVSATLLQTLRDSKLPKGDAITVAQIAGIIGAKKTSELIPMCHPLPLNFANVKIELPKGDCLQGGDIAIFSEVKTVGRTGAEMEALTAAAVAALALYDMCKAVDKHMEITGLRVVSKTGGKSGDWSVQSRNQIND